MSDHLWRDTAPLRAPQSAGRVRPPRPWLALWVLAAVAVVVGVASVFGPVVWFAATYGCDSDDSAHAQQLAASEVLDLFPPGTQAVGGRDTGCEDDDEMAMASQDYRSGQLTRGEVLAFYEQSLTAAGRLVTFDGDEDPRLLEPAVRRRRRQPVRGPGLRPRPLHGRTVVGFP